METIEILTDEHFQKIYSDPKFRNEVAFACKNCNSTGNFKYWATASYPKQYIVTEEQMEIAKHERDKANISLREKYKNDLLFKGMGSEFIPRWEDDVTNYRFRTWFKNRHGISFFIEIMPARDNGLFIDGATNLDDEKEFRNKLNKIFDEQIQFKKSTEKYWQLSNQIIEFRKNEPTHNYSNICRDQRGYKCTQSDIVKLINEVFECDFKRMIIDEYDLILGNEDDILCFSPGPDYQIPKKNEDKFIDNHSLKESGMASCDVGKETSPIQLTLF